jgi:hypothetical protein
MRGAGWGSGGRVEGGQELDRRAFLRRASQTGVAAGALAWSTPRLSSVRTDAAQAGSPPPVTPPTIGGRQLTPGGAIDISGGSGAAPGGNLAQTGAELGQLAVIGGAALAAGQMLRKKGLRLDELTGERGARPAVPPVDSPGAD